jgi:phospholipase C
VPFSITTVGGVPTATCTGIYNSHHAPFDYYQGTSNPDCIPPSSLAAIGADTCANQLCANHNYDLSYFYQALNRGNLPAVTYLKFSENDTGHPSDSTPLLEKTSIVNAINAIERSPFWQDTAIMIPYDDSDGCTTTSRDPLSTSRRTRLMTQFRATLQLRPARAVIRALASS